MTEKHDTRNAPARHTPGPVRARRIVDEWLTAKGYTPPSETDFLSYARACRKTVGGRYPDAIDTEDQACRLVREFAQIVLDEREDEKRRAYIRRLFAKAESR